MAARGLLIGVLRECLAGSGEGNERGTCRRAEGRLDESRDVSKGFLHLINKLQPDGC